MPSVISILMREQLRLLKPVISKLSIPYCRSAQDSIGNLGAKALGSKLASRLVKFDNFSANLITPRDADDGVILYLHGGGYTAGGLKYAAGFGSVLASRLNRRVLCSAYRLAPEDPFPAALVDAYESYRYLINEGYAPSDITLAGESAGGGLVFCLTHYLKDRGEPLPGRIIAISPWADLTMTSNSCEINDELDPSLSKRLLEFYAKVYAGDDLKNKLISPIFGDFTEFPPALIFVGTDEILLDDAKALKDGYDTAGVPCELHTVLGQWHVYVLFAVPEAQEAIDRMDDFIKETEHGKQVDDAGQRGENISGGAVTQLDGDVSPVGASD